MENPDPNLIQKFKEFVGIYIESLAAKANKTVPKQKRDHYRKKILEYSYGLNSKYYSQEQIAMFLNLSIEMVRLIKIATLKEIKAKIDELDTDIFNRYYLEDIKKLDSCLVPQKVMSMNQFYRYLNEEYQIDTNKEKSHIELLIDALGYKVINHHQLPLREYTLIFFDKSIDSKLICKIGWTAFKIVEKNTILTEEEDIIIGIKKSLNHTAIDRRLVVKALSVMGDCEFQTKGRTRLYQVALHRLSSASDMAYRILFEKKDGMKINDIHDEISLRLSSTGKKVILMSSLNTELSSDKRFKSSGKAGIWSLSEWAEDKVTMVELISNTLLHFNEPLFKDDIFSHILRVRPFISVNSLSRSLCDPAFVQLVDGRFILAQWRDAYQSKIMTGKRRHHPFSEFRRGDHVKL